MKWNLDLIYFYITALARYRDGREVRTKLILSRQFGNTSCLCGQINPAGSGGGGVGKGG